MNTSGKCLIRDKTARFVFPWGQTKVAEKSNEIKAIPALLDLLTLEGAIVTIDAMGCQREIAQKIIDIKADYILALKGNQGTLRDDVERLLQQQKAHGYTLQKVDQFAGVDKDHGRLETRKTTVFDDVAPLQKTHQWPGLQSLIMIEHCLNSQKTPCSASTTHIP